MFDVYYKSDNGLEYCFGPKGSTWFGMNVGDGVEVTFGTSQGFSQIGDTVETQSVGGRPITIKGQVYGNIIQRKNELRKVFAPFTSGKLIFQNKYYIRVYVKAAPTFSPVKNNGLFTMQMYAPFPFYYELSETTALIGAVQPLFRFPVNYGTPHRFGTKAEGKYTNIVNDGDVKVPFKVHIRADAECSNVIITNMRTLEYLRLNGVLGTGDVVNIYRDDSNVLRAELTAEGVTTDIISWIDEGSTLFELNVGDNIISAVDDEGGANLTVRFSFSPAVGAVYET